MKRILGIIGSGMICLSSAAFAVEPKTWELNDGRWPEVPTTNPASLAKTDPALKAIEDRLDRGDASTAVSDALDWVRVNPTHPNIDAGLYLSARALDASGDPIKAFYYCDQLMDEHPSSTLYAPALELQYRLADSLLNGRKLTALGLFDVLDGSTEAIEMLFRIQTRSPGSPVADRALRRTADYYFSHGDFDFASDAYGAYAKTYPRSPDMPEVLLRQALSNYAQFNGVRFDPTPLNNARSQMVELIDKYPEKAKQENIPAFVESIDRMLAHKLYDTADYYRRTGKPMAQQQLLQTLVKVYPNSDEAKDARSLIGEPMPAPSGVNAQ